MRCRSAPLPSAKRGAEFREIAARVDGGEEPGEEDRRAPSTNDQRRDPLMTSVGWAVVPGRTPSCGRNREAADPRNPRAYLSLPHPPRASNGPRRAMTGSLGSGAL